MNACYIIANGTQRQQSKNLLTDNTPLIVAIRINILLLSLNKFPIFE